MRVDELREVNERLLLAAVREQELAEEARREAAKMDALLRSLSDGVAVFDPAGRVVMINAAGREAAGVPDAAEGWTPAEYRHLDLRRSDGTPLPFEEQPLARAIRGERFSGAEVVLVHPGDSRRRLTVSGSVVRNDAGEVILAVLVFRDVTELRRLEALKAEYVSLISHDLRAPLNAILGYSELLQMKLSPGGLEREAKHAAAIARSARQMNAMIQDLLDSTRLDAGGLEMRREPTDLTRLVADVIQGVGSPADRQRIRVQVPEAPCPVSADRERLDRVLLNLLTNALKYSPPEAPVLVRLEPRDGEMIVSVIDRGVGVPPEEMAHLFGRFYRATTGTKTGGLGLGLYISRLIVEAHGGRIWVESEVGEGSRFHFALRCC